jgi:hypothetical protein
MKHPANTELKVNQALNSLEGCRRAGAGPFFFTRVQARMNKIEVSIWETISGFIAKPGIAITAICFVILMNAIVLFNVEEGSPALAEQTALISAEEYNMAVRTFYENVNPEP